MRLSHQLKLYSGISHASTCARDLARRTDHAAGRAGELLIPGICNRDRSRLALSLLGALHGVGTSDCESACVTAS